MNNTNFHYLSKLGHKLTKLKNALNYFCCNVHKNRTKYFFTIMLLIATKIGFRNK